LLTPKWSGVLQISFAVMKDSFITTKLNLLGCSMTMLESKQKMQKMDFMKTQIGLQVVDTQIPMPDTV
jgi:hypothetical protein